MQRSIFVIAAIVLVAVLGAWIWWVRESPPQGNGKTRLTNTPPDVEILQLNNRGVGQMEFFEPEKAVDTFLEVYRKAPNWLPGHINLAIALFNTRDMNQITRAVDIFEKVLVQDPDNLQAHFCLGIIFLHRGSLEEAKAHFEAVARRDPADAHTWFCLGQVQDPLSPRARECYEKALELNPHMLGALNQLAGIYRREDDKKADAFLKR